MAYLNLYRENLRHNFEFLKKMFDENDLHWGVVTKLLCGNGLYLKEVIDMGVREVTRFPYQQPGEDQAYQPGGADVLYQTTRRADHSADHPLCRCEHEYGILYAQAPLR